MEQTVRQLQGDIPLEQQIIRNKIRSADKIQDHFSEQILERTQRVIFNIEIGGKLPAESAGGFFDTSKVRQDERIRYSNPRNILKAVRLLFGECRNPDVPF